MNTTGDGLTFLLECDYTILHNWMSFASWYSFSKNLPDAKFIIACKRAVAPKVLFTWVGKCNVPFFQYSSGDSLEIARSRGLAENVIKIKPSMMAVRENSEDFGPVLVKSNDRATLVDYEAGCGRYNPDNWQKETGPFEDAVEIFSKIDISINELAVLKMWERSYQIYTIVI